jgi:transcriptional regulator with GAF, ATPase, and Fis domain
VRLKQAADIHGEWAVEQLPDELQDAVAALSRVLLTDDGLDSALHQVADLAVSVIEACDCCGVSVSSEGNVTSRVTTNDVAQRIDDDQYAANDGPCLTAVRTGATVKIDSISDEVRWPAFTHRAKTEGIHSSCSVPLPVDHSIVGALNLYSASGPFGERDEWTARQLAVQAAVTLANAVAFQRMGALVSNLMDALASRDVIGEAKGIIMERQRCTPDAAFDILRIASQRQNVKLRDLAQRVVDTGTWERLD